MSGVTGGQGRDPHLALFDDLYAEQHRPVYAYLLGAVGDRDVAADLLQEVFLRLWQHRATAAAVPVERRRFWLFRVARNVRLDHYRRRGARAAHESPLPDGEAAEALSAGGLASTVDIDVAIAGLPEDLRTVLAMSALGGMNSAEIGEALDRPAGTVRYQLSRARLLLAEELDLTRTGGVQA
ncbi:MAG: RNA polymerase sigma factor [Anaerolineae bacterium]